MTAVRVAVFAVLMAFTAQTHATAASSPAAAAPSQRERARKLFLQAEVHFSSGEYQAALRGYERAFTLTGLRGFLLNIAHCHARLGNIREATKHYRFFLQRAPATDVHRPAVQEALAALTGVKARGPRPAPAAAKAASKKASTAETRDVPAAPVATLVAQAKDEGDNESYLPRPNLAMQGEPAGLNLQQATEVPAQKQRALNWVWPALGAAVLAAGATWFLISQNDRTPLQEGSIGTLSR
ncbi:MAG: hypothetical protein SF187_23160 [Deltaproteobacteria bacterium]|nr:hypothetical protein [Deltaproteobacteria bacterium]